MLWKDFATVCGRFQVSRTPDGTYRLHELVRERAKTGALAFHLTWLTHDRVLATAGMAKEWAEFVCQRTVTVDVNGLAHWQYTAPIAEAA